MDPNATLQRFRDAMERLTNVRNAYADSTTGATEPFETYIQEAAEEAADAAADLDHWLTRGGFLPTAWQKG